MPPHRSNAHAAPQHRTSRDAIHAGPDPSTDVRPDVLPIGSVRSAPILHDVKAHPGSCVPACPSSSGLLSPEIPAEPAHDDGYILRSNCHGLPGGKLGLLDGAPLYNSPWRSLRRLSGIALSVLVVLILLSGHPLAPLDNVVSAMARASAMLRVALGFVVLTTVTPGHSAVPSSFPASGKVLWYRAPAASWSKEYLPVGNGFLAG
jgi:hypothetical protein